MRKLTHSDIPILVQIAEKVLPQRWRKEDFEYFISHPASYSAAVVDEGNEVVSFYLALKMGLDLDTLIIATHPDHQRKGWAQKILNGIQQDLNIVKMFLEVDTRNKAAIALYEKCGFQTLGIRKKYYQEKYDAFNMRWIRSNS